MKERQCVFANAVVSYVSCDLGSQVLLGCTGETKCSCQILHIPNIKVLEEKPIERSMSMKMFKLHSMSFFFHCSTETQKPELFWTMLHIWPIIWGHHKQKRGWPKTRESCSRRHIGCHTGRGHHGWPGRRAHQRPPGEPHGPRAITIPPSPSRCATQSLDTGIEELGVMFHRIATTHQDTQRPEEYQDTKVLWHRFTQVYRYWGIEHKWGVSKHQDTNVIEAYEEVKERHIYREEGNMPSVFPAPTLIALSSNSDSKLTLRMSHSEVTTSAWYAR